MSSALACNLLFPERISRFPEERTHAGPAAGDVWLSRVARAARAEQTPRIRAARRAGGLRRRHVLGPLSSVDRATGAERLHVVVARRRAAGDASDIRLRERARLALSPGDHRTGRRDALRNVSGAVLARRRQRRSAERAHHGRTLAGEKRAQRALARERDGDAKALGRRDGHALRPHRGRGGKALHTSREAATALRRGVERRDRGMGRLLGGRIDHDWRAGRKARRGGGVRFAAAAGQASR